MINLRPSLLSLEYSHRHYYIHHRPPFPLPNQHHVAKMRPTLLSTLPLLSFLSFLTTTLAQNNQIFTCNSTSAQNLPICCGEYYAYNQPGNPEPSDLYYSILCTHAPAVISNGTEAYQCGTVEPAVKPACCDSVSFGFDFGEVGDEEC